MADPVFIFATIRPKPEHFADARNAILEMMPLTLAEEGCHQFELYEATHGRKTLHLWEQFASEEALTFHHDQNYTRRVFEAYEEWLEVPVDITRLAAVEVTRERHPE